MRNFLTYIGPSERKPYHWFQCVCGEMVEKRKNDVKNGKFTSCGCASPRQMNTGKSQDPLYNLFHAHKYHKLWDSYFDFRAELGTPDPNNKNPWVVPIVPGTKIAPGNVRWGRPEEHFFDFSTSDLDMHHKKFKEQSDLHNLSKEIYALEEDDVDSWEFSLNQIRAKHREMAQSDTYEWQKKVEQEARDYAKLERDRQEADAYQKGRASQTQVARLFRYQLVTCLSELLKENYTHAMAAGTGSNLKSVDQLLKKGGLDYMTIAHITVTVVMDKLGRNTAFQSTIGKMLLEIGQKLDHQSFINHIEAYCPQEFEKVNRWYLKNGEMGYIQKIRNSRVIVSEKLNYPFLGKKDQAQVGAWCFKAFESMTKWFEKESIPNTDGKKGHTNYLKLSEEGMKHRLMLQRVADLAEYESWAMVHPPEDWDVSTTEDGKTAFKRGGYLLEHPGSVRKLIHNDHGTIPSVSAINAINKQQQVAFRINKFIYDTQVALLSSYNEIGAFKTYEADSWVDEHKPYIDPAVWEQHSQSPEYRKAKRDLKNFYGDQKKAEKLHKNPFRVLKQAARFVDCDRFYFSCYFDARLRIYTHAVGLTYQGSDYQKALLKFADGVKVTNENRSQVRGEMLVSIANTYGNDKISFDERIQFAETLVRDLEFVAKDPLTTQSMTIWCHAADEPFQFLALLREYYEVFEWKTKTHTDIPGGRDATNSGNQILGAICRDEKTCYYTNVIPEWNGHVATKPQDLYGVVADGMKPYLNSDVWVSGELERYREQAKKRAEKENREIDDNLQFALDPELLTHLNRKHVKRAVMIDAYGGSWRSKNEHISEELSETAKSKDITISLAEKRLVTSACILSQKNSFPLSDELNQWFKQVGKLSFEKGLQFITWKTPDGSKIIQEYLEPNIITVPTYAMGGGSYHRPQQPRAARGKGKKDNRMSVNIREGWKQEVQKGKMATALGANFTHSHDASIIRGGMNQIDTPFFGIHDCIYGPHGTLEDACKKLRVSFLTVCSEDALQGLIDSNELEMSKPTMGNADITVCIQNAPYMFS